MDDGSYINDDDDTIDQDLSSLTSFDGLHIIGKYSGRYKRRSSRHLEWGKTFCFYVFGAEFKLFHMSFFNIFFVLFFAPQMYLQMKVNFLPPTPRRLDSIHRVHMHYNLSLHKLQIQLTSMTVITWVWLSSCFNCHHGQRIAILH